MNQKIIIIYPMSLLLFLLLPGCATHPQLYPNEKYDSVGKVAAESDIKDCEQKAEAHVENEKAKQVAAGAGRGAVLGGVIGGLFSGGLRGAVRGASAGAVIGGAGGALTPKQLHQHFVNICLEKKGYQVIGWD